MTEPDNTNEGHETQQGEREDAPPADQSPDDSQSGPADAEPKKKRRKVKKQPIDLSKVADAIEPDGAGESDDSTPDAESAVEDDEGDEGDVSPSDDLGDADENPEPEDAGAASEEGNLDGAMREAREVALRAAVEAIIFAADDPVTPAAIAKAIGDVKPSGVKKAIDQLRAIREESGSGIAIEEVAGGWTMLTNEEYAPAIRRLRKATESRKLTGAALETLAVVAYKQPIQKQEIEDIRGVSCGPILRTLMEQNLVKIAGRAEALGRPLLYGTTKRFLDVFGIASLKDLPKISELTRS
jgi:segregation and condensation protein B